MKQILFSSPMAIAINGGQKTQTRREVKGMDALSCINEGITKGIETLCPYGQPNDILWVRETYFAFGRWVKNGFSENGRQKWRFEDMTLSEGHSYQYADTMQRNTCPRYKTGWHKRPSLYMPKVACRLFLEITRVRVERLHEISEADAIAEGIEFDNDAKGWIDYRYGYGGSVWLPEYPKESFRTLWESINGTENWIQNPHVWAIDFKNIDKPVNF